MAVDENIITIKAKTHVHTLAMSPTGEIHATVDVETPLQLDAEQNHGRHIFLKQGSLKLCGEIPNGAAVERVDSKAKELAIYLKNARAVVA